MQDVGIASHLANYGGTMVDDCGFRQILCITNLLNLGTVLNGQLQNRHKIELIY